MEELKAYALRTGVTAKTSSDDPGILEIVKRLNYRFHWTKFDSCQLYRRHLRLREIDVLRPVELNIDAWLAPNSDRRHSELSAAVFHYSGFEIGKQDARLEVCLATPDMTDAAWKYGHNSQIVLDGTFGFCNSRMLLFVALAVGSDTHGIPIAFFLFSAPSGAIQTAANYDTTILTKLLHKWKEHCSQQGKGTFAPRVVITDTDTRERTALSTVWPGIKLLLCKFHVRQCWTNRRNKTLRVPEEFGPVSLVVRDLGALEEK